MIIGITGTLAAGKGTVSDILMKQGFRHYSVRAYIVKEIERRGLPNNRDSMVLVGNDLRREHGADYIARELYREAARSGENAIIESLRALGEVKALQAHDDFFLIAVDADQKTRYERSQARKSETDRVSYEEFVRNERREMHSRDPTKQNIGACMKLADAVIMNDGTVQSLEEKVNLALEGFRKKR